MIPVWTVRSDREALAETVAESVAHTLLEAIERRGRAFVAFAGGSTPAPAYARLVEHPRLDWGKVVVTLTDERIAPAGHPARNEGLLEPFRSKGANFVPLEDEAAIAKMPEFDSVLLGMGADGHTASLFPGADELEAAMDPHGQRAVLRITPAELPPEAPFARLTLTVPRLARTRCCNIMITGEAKKAIAEDAVKNGDPCDPPIRGVLHALPVRPEFFWSP
ncbi:6-phosphogluconolactonase [Caulobacter sp. 17J80-11]|uniref:6-phosphogluconolactonase n=1 Tax=Caulobacter sp. 17J80-11 TaxID=2763502 RepID=UPI001653CA6A|nr:6-phosphogluconolactonase [Caulobacter sp. 17J80-11]MBC6983440.1 6-phosphogluconolactonase [Caulobacter sp. 17J80-11]